jgi:hypothetical protein
VLSHPVGGAFDGVGWADGDDLGAVAIQNNLNAHGGFSSR